MITTLSLDLETRSSVDLAKCGVYRYCESPDFDILLFGVSVNCGPVTVYDLACGETVPEEILAALTDDSATKWAFNCGFERVCLSSWLRRKHPERFSSYSIPGDPVRNYLDPSSWRCSMVLAAYNGLPLSLEKVGEVLGLEQQKMKEGRDLIRFFCTPSRAAGRAWNLPEHAPDKWETFKAYNKRDVEVEMQIHQRLRNYAVPDSVWEEYCFDQEINDRGIMIDRQLVEQAIRIDELSKASLTDEMKERTGLDNPNSVTQLKGYLNENGMEVDALGKKDVAALMETAPGDLAEVLSLRLQLAKSSVKKYTAMRNAACADDRCHGMFQFYGANRTGRFAGRIVQLQNLPQNHLPDLEQARELVRTGDYEMLSALYDSVPNVLSELIRTAFIPAPGFKFVVSDFSAIEARVLSYLAGEQWRMDVFHDGRDIYCMSASQMFGVPVEKHGQNAHLRQKGKVAELACIAEGQLVLTDHGLVPIENVTTKMMLWDGTEWVSHDGVIYKGERDVIEYEGLTATPDHLVWIEGKSEPVQFGVAAACGAHLIQTGDGRNPIRLGENHQPGEAVEREPESLLCSDTVPGLRSGSADATGQSAQREIAGMPELLSAEADSALAGQAVDCGKAALRESERSAVSELRCAGYPLPVSERAGGRAVSDRNLRSSGAEDGAGPDRQQRTLCSGEYPLCDQGAEYGKPQMHRAEPVRAEVLALRAERSNQEIICRTEPGRDHTGCGKGCGRASEELAHHQRTARLYDIRNAGRHHRFTVSGRLVHNCGYGGSVGALKAMGALSMGLTEEELPPLVSMWREANPHIVQYWWVVDNAVKTAIKKHIPTSVGCVRFEYRSGMLFAHLPSGRRLSYVKPQMGVNRFGGESITYMGVDGTKHWSRIESYGPKFVENITQAISRDILCHAMRTLSYCRIVGHVHDEVILEVSKDASLDAICEQMGRTPPWLPGIELRADGYECGFYQKQ